MPEYAEYSDLNNEARELILYMENERAWHEGILYVNGTLASHWIGNSFDLDLGIKAFQRVTLSAAKQYHLEHGTMTDRVQDIFPKSSRDQVCEFLARSFVSTVRQPEVWDDLGERAAAKLRKAKRYPRTNREGVTVWACCESSIGPVCEHRAERP